VHHVLQAAGLLLQPQTSQTLHPPPLYARTLGSIPAVQQEAATCSGFTLDTLDLP
jgi:hypothetical protein